MRPSKYFASKKLRVARKAAKDRGHRLWKYKDTGYLGSGYYVGEYLPTAIANKSADRMTVRELKV